MIGFSILAIQIGQIQNFDASQSQDLLRSLTTGLGVALLTTMVGLVGNILLGLQLTRLDRYADTLVAEAQRHGLAGAWGGHRDRRRPFAARCGLSYRDVVRPVARDQAGAALRLGVVLHRPEAGLRPALLLYFAPHRRRTSPGSRAPAVGRPRHTTRGCCRGRRVPAAV